MPVLDAHVHIFPPDIIKKRTKLAEREEGFRLLYRDERARMVDGSGIASYMDNEAIDKVIAVAFPFADPGLLRLQNDYILDQAKADGRIIPFVMVDTTRETAAIAEMERCACDGARGIGELAWYAQGFGRNERMALSGLAARAERTGLVMMLHVNEPVGHAYAGKTKTEFDQLSGFVEEHPNLRIILAHMGGGICFYEFMPEIRKIFSRVYYDSAAIPFLYSDGIYEYAARFLPHKVLFGSDYPLLGFQRYKPRFERLEAAVRDAFLFGNGRDLFGD